MRDELALLDELVEQGILSDERCPAQDHLHWDVVKPDQLPAYLQENYKNYSEIRFYMNRP